MSEQTQVSAEVAVRCRGIGKSYRDGETAITALTEFSFDFAFEQLTAVIGPSGSGKSTLLGILAAIEYADEGSVEIGDTELGSLSSVEQTEFRASTISYLFPDNNLIPMLSVYENITLALSAKKLPESEIDRRTRAALSQLGIEDLSDRRPAKLSSGQRSRAAIAGAIASENPILIIDEPTARLDAANASVVARLLRDIASSSRRCVIVATHDPLVTNVATGTVNLGEDRAAE